MEDKETILGFNKFEKALIIVVPMMLGAVYRFHSVCKLLYSIGESPRVCLNLRKK
jgi:hypothetical protein